MAVATLPRMCERAWWSAPGTIVAVLLMLSVGACEKSPEEKAREWIDQGEYLKARQELERTLGGGSGKASTRILIAQSYLGEARAGGHAAPDLLLSALTVLSPLDLAVGESAADPVKTAVFERLAELAKGPEGAEILPIVRRFPSPSAFGILASLVEGIDESAALAAGEEMYLRDQERARTHLVALMARAEGAVQRRAARILWTRERHEPARPLVRAALMGELVTTENRKRADILVRQLDELGSESAAEAFVGVIKQAAGGLVPIEPALAALSLLTRRDAEAAGETVRSVVRFTSVEDAARRGCDKTMGAFVGALGAMKGAANDAALKDALSYVILIADARCTAVYLKALANGGDPAWASLRIGTNLAAGRYSRQ